jgi:DNA-binding beta-propeller fold protein YncE
MMPMGEVAVADMLNSRVQIFDGETGEYKRQFGTSGKKDGQFISPCGVAVDAEGNLLVVDTGTPRLQVFTSDGNHVCTRDGIGLGETHGKVEWGLEGALALTSSGSHSVLLWTGC